MVEKEVPETISMTRANKRSDQGRVRHILWTLYRQYRPTVHPLFHPFDIDVPTRKVPATGRVPCHPFVHDRPRSVGTAIRLPMILTPRTLRRSSDIRGQERGHVTGIIGEDQGNRVLMKEVGRNTPRETDTEAMNLALGMRSEVESQGGTQREGIMEGIPPGA